VSAYAKAIAAAITAGLIAAQTAIPMSGVWHGWVTVALAALGAGAVYQVRNTPPPPALVDESARLQNPQVWMGQDVPPTADPAEGAGGVTRGDQ
jgi:hypothetical protein